jgi:hypothetical protein
LDHVNNDLAEQAMDQATISEEDQNCFLVATILGAYQSGEAKFQYDTLLSVLSGVSPHVKYRVAWKVCDVWSEVQHTRHASATLPEMLTGVRVAALLLNKPALAVCLCVCFAALLRVFAALNMTARYICSWFGSVTFRLGRTKRGLEQKVVCCHPGIIGWVCAFLSRFPVSCNSVVVGPQAGELMGATSLGLTTDSCGRSEASELARVGVPLPDFMLYVRRLFDRFAR